MDNPVLMWQGHPLDYWLHEIESPDDDKRHTSVDALRHIAHPTTSVPIFIRVITHDNYAFARGLAAHAIYDICVDKEYRPLIRSYLSALIGFLLDSDIEVLLQVVETLELLGTDAIQAVPRLRIVAECENVELKKAADNAITTIITGRDPIKYKLTKG